MPFQIPFLRNINIRCTYAHATKFIISSYNLNSNCNNKVTQFQLHICMCECICVYIYIYVYLNVYMCAYVHLEVSIVSFHVTISENLSLHCAPKIPSSTWLSHHHEFNTFSSIIPFLPSCYTFAIHLPLKYPHCHGYLLVSWLFSVLQFRYMYLKTPGCHAHMRKNMYVLVSFQLMLQIVWPRQVTERKIYLTCNYRGIKSSWWQNRGVLFLPAIPSKQQVAKAAAESSHLILQFRIRVCWLKIGGSSLKL